jgi:type IV pilus assembly protein PilP
LAGAADGGSAQKEKPPEWVYSSIGKRDPFRSFMTMEGEKNVTNNRCNSPLGKYELDQMKLVAVITGISDPLAMVELPTGVGFTVRRGACIGRNGGTVSSIRTGEVVVSEWVVKADQTKEKTQTVLKQPRPNTNGIEPETEARTSSTTTSAAPMGAPPEGAGPSRPGGRP